MSKAAGQQAALATESIGDVPTVKTQSRQAAELLNVLAADFQKNPPSGSQQAASDFARDAGEVSGGLQAIAESRTDAGFTNAVFAMCDPTRRDAAPRVGQVMMLMAAAIREKAPSSWTLEQQQSAIRYFETFGGRLTNIPAQCDQASNAMAEASAEEQQAEAEHQANVNRAALTAAVAFAGVALYASAVASRPVYSPPPAPAPELPTYTQCNPNAFSGGFSCYSR